MVKHAAPAWFTGTRFVGWHVAGALSMLMTG